MEPERGSCTCSLINPGSAWGPSLLTLLRTDQHSAWAAAEQHFKVSLCYVGQHITLM